MTARYATLSELRSALAARGIHPRHALGQHFLVDLNLLRCVAEAGEIEPRDVVLEVGCAGGALTALLSERACAVVAAEIDPALADLADEALDCLPNVRLVRGDALGARGHLSRELRQAVASALAAAPGARLKLVANLPYGIATAVMKAMLLHGPRPALIAATVQREVADRMAAPAGHHAYGLLSVLLQCQGTVERLRTLRPTVFWPRPKVSSALVRVRLLDAPPVDPAALVRVAGKLFEQRRKQVAKAMQIGRLAEDAGAAAALCAETGMDPHGRPGDVPAEAFVRLVRLLAKEKG